jgi:hypothetical protein
MCAVAVRDLELDLDAFEGPFDLLLTLVLKEELELSRSSWLFWSVWTTGATSRPAASSSSSWLRCSS